ncbi:MAG TPA: ECF-type sigma factor [Pyrinomonadaceae bacterium]
MSAPHNITQLLVEWGNGDRGALDKLAPLVEGELHRLAHARLRDERHDNLLQTTALVNEAFIGLLKQSRVELRDRANFFAYAAGVMRNILLNYARARNTIKRGGDVVHVNLDEVAVVSAEKSAELIALDEAMTLLAAQDQRASLVVELRYFGGFTIEETAAMLGVAKATVQVDWDFAKTWLLREMRR